MSDVRLACFDISATMTACTAARLGAREDGAVELGSRR